MREPSPAAGATFRRRFSALVCLSLVSLGGCAARPARLETPAASAAGAPDFAPRPNTAPQAEVAGPTAPEAAAATPAHPVFELAASTTPPPGNAGCAARLGKRVLRRSALSHTLDAGLGAWLGGVDVKPKVVGGHFEGWQLRALFSGDPCWSDVELQAGDIIRHINHRPIEKPEEALAVWSDLRHAAEISVDFVRSGQRRTLVYAVVDDDSAATPH